MLPADPTDAGENATQAAKERAQHEARPGRVDERLAMVDRRVVGPPASTEPRRQGGEGQVRGRESPERPARRVHVLRLEAVPTDQKGLLQRYPESPGQQEGQHERALELGVSQPEGVARSSTLEREQIHEHRSGAGEEHVVGSRILETPALG